MLRLANSKTGINPIIAWKCFAYFIILLMYITDYHLAQICVRPVTTLEKHTRARKHT